MWNNMQSDAGETRSVLIARRYGDVTDWNGAILRKGVFAKLRPGDTVRVAIEDVKNFGQCAPYFVITQIKDGTFWGRLDDVYNSLDWAMPSVLEDGVSIFPFRAQNIIEIPIDWQSKRQQKQLLPFLASVRKGYAMTGMRV